MLWAIAAWSALSAHAQAPTNAPASNAVTAPVALALILPGPDTPFARPSEAVREGFVAAHAATRAPLAIQVVEIDASSAQAVEAMRSARDRGVQIIVGPLTRAAVNGAVTAGDIGVPTLFLNVPEDPGALAASQLAFGLSVEDEAALLVRAALRQVDPGVTASRARRHVVVAGDGALARRTAAAFVAALRAAAETVVTLDFARLGADGVAAAIARTPATAIFLALDVGDAVQVRTRLPIDAPLYATSQINAAAGGALLANDLEGVRFVDMPWLIDPERAAVRAYPRPAVGYSAELQRLYALGIDAYRIALEWLAGRRRFEIDGVTGWLRVDRERNARVERMPGFAVFREGRIERDDSLRDVNR